METEDLDTKWVDDTLNIVRLIAKRKEEFTADDIWNIAEHLKETPEDRRMLGRVMKLAASKKYKYCVASDRFIPSKRRINHGRRIMVWESLLFEE